uniref:NADH-ubiquinone oxidoreductase chain 4L n=1 Tax=Xyloterini sp. TaxID=2995406 RepID=A0A9E8G7I3_9CUCU|nr:NADH dehydrogenase subunit 4L [Xyloterini sp.]
MMMYFCSYFLLSLFFSGLYIFIMKFKHFLLLLMGLEIMMLSIYMMMFIYFIQFCGEFYFSMVYLTMSVCEGALGLSLLVLMIRSWSNDKLLLMDNLW